MNKRPQDTPAEEPDGGNPHIRFRGGPRLGDRPGLLNRALARGRGARAIQDAAFGELRRQLRYKSEWYGPLLLEVDRWYASSKHCSMCRFRLDELRLDQRQWRCPQCGTFHDRDINAARNLLTQGVRQLAGRDDRDLRVDAGDACPEEHLLVQVLAEEARSGHRNRAGLESARLG